MRRRAVVVCRVAWGRRWVCLEGCHRYGEASRRASRVVIVVSSGSEGLVSANVVVSIEADSEGRKIESLGSFVRTWRCCCSDLSNYKSGRDPRRSRDVDLGSRGIS